MKKQRNLLFFQFMCISPININGNCMCTEDENKALRLYRLVPQAKPWGLTNQPRSLTYTGSD